VSLSLFQLEQNLFTTMFLLSFSPYATSGLSIHRGSIHTNTKASSSSRVIAENSSSLRRLRKATHRRYNLNFLSLSISRLPRSPPGSSPPYVCVLPQFEIRRTFSTLSLSCSIHPFVKFNKLRHKCFPLSLTRSRNEIIAAILITNECFIVHIRG
jgi:hypothetical protein